MWMWMLLSCMSGVRSSYTNEKMEVLRPAPPLLNQWEGDVRVRMSAEALSRIAHQAVSHDALKWSQTLEFQPLIGPTVRLRPTINVERLRVRPSQYCASCLRLRATLRGEARISAGPLAGSIPFQAKVSFTTQLQMEQEDDIWRVTSEIEQVDDLQVTALGALGSAISIPIEAWLSTTLENLGAMELATIGSEALPLRGIRLDTRSGTIVINARTNLAHTTRVTPGPALEAQWDIRMHPDTLVALMRHHAFTSGPGKHQIVDAPRSLRVDGDRFELDLRLWRLAGSGWWRDYTVSGIIAVIDDTVQLQPTRAIPTGKSHLAGLADPIFLLAERKTLRAVTEGVRRAVPAGTETAVGDFSLRPRITGIHGTTDAIVIEGEID